MARKLRPHLLAGVHGTTSMKERDQSTLASPDQIPLKTVLPYLITSEYGTLGILALKVFDYFSVRDTFVRNPGGRGKTKNI